MLKWAETNPELAIAFLTFCAAPIIAGIARQLFPHREAGSSTGDRISSEMREALTEMSVNIKLTQQTQLEILLETKRILVAIHEHQARD